MTILRIVKLAMIAALYVVLTVLFAPISFGPIQFRISEVLVLLCFFKRDYCISLILGCFIANLFSIELGYVDLIFGTLHTAISVILISFTKKNMFIASLWPTIFMPIIAFELWYFLGYEFFTTWLTLVASEFIVVSIIGYILFFFIRKNETLVKFIEE
ncbi:MAG: QueT transporter family protein [Bacilli bacterium]|nr:QueT transporter family protein [Bacilli bacterium]